MTTKPLTKIIADLRESIAAAERYSGPQNMSVLSSQLTAVLDALEQATKPVDAAGSINGAAMSDLIANDQLAYSGS